MLSLDIFTNGEVFIQYAKSIQRFLDRGGNLVWGIVPTNFEPFGKEDAGSLEARIASLWDALASRGIDRELLLSRSLISPATCCLVNQDREKTVEKAFKLTKELSARLRERFALA